MSMIKIISPGAYDFSQPSTSLIKVSSRGLIGSDLSSFVKRASHEFVDIIKKAELKPGDVPVHLIAIGAGEYYGCFFKGAPVQTIDGMKPIEEVVEGTDVLTHKNRYRPVTYCFKKTYTGDKTTITIANMPEQFISTGNHPVWVVRKEDFSLKDRCKCFLKDKTPEEAVENTIKEKAQFVDARTIRKDDFVIVPIRPDVEAAPIPQNLAYLYGMYLAEGCTFKESRKGRPSFGKRRGIILTVSENDIPSIDRIQSEIGIKLTKNKSFTSEVGLRFTLNNHDIAEECAKLFGEHSTKKRLNPIIFKQARKWKLAFIAGYLDGDGSIVKTGKTRYQGTVIASTASLNLSLDIQRLLASIGVASGISKNMNLHSNGCFGKKDHVIYQISVGSSHSPDAIANCVRLQWPEGLEKRKHKSSSTHVGKSYMLLPVRKIATENVESEEVYNLEVAEDNTYIGLISTHNSNRNLDHFGERTCREYHPTFKKYARFYYNHQNRNPKKSYGYVKESMYNEDMHRIELLAILNGTKEAAKRNGGLVANEELEKLARDEDIAVSMACTVPFDVCSECGHKAKNRAEYCTSKSEGGFCTRDGAKHALGRVYADGRVHYVDNPNPRYFDISKVLRPADRIAYVLGKVASNEHLYKAGGAELAELMNVTAPAHLLIDESTPEKISKQVKLAYELSTLESQIENEDSPNTLYLAFSKEAVRNEHLFTMPQYENTQAAVTALAREKVILPVEGFLSFVTGNTEKAAQVANSVSMCLPGIYTRMLADDSIIQLAEKNDFMPTNSLPNLNLRSWASKKAEDFSLDKNEVNRRILRSALYNVRPVRRLTEKNAAAGEAVEHLARSYALYKLATLQYLENYDENFDLTKELSIRQHYV